MAVTQTEIFSNIRYKDTVIDIYPYFELDTCERINYNNTIPKSEVPTVSNDSFFLNNKYDTAPFADYMDTLVFTKPDKIILLEYDFLSCFPCLIAMQSYSRLLDSLGDKIQIIIIAPIDPTTKSPLADKLMEKYNIKGRVDYHLLREGADKITYVRYIKNYPLLLVIDKDGIVRAVKVGINKDEDSFEAIYNLVKPFVE